MIHANKINIIHSIVPPKQSIVPTQLDQRQHMKMKTVL